MDEVRLAFRRLIKRPVASIAGVWTLAFSIGAVAATWPLLSAVLLRPLTVVEPDRLKVVGQLRSPQGTPPQLELGMAPDSISNTSQTAPTTSRSLVVRATGDLGQARRDVMGTIKQMDPAVTPAPLVTVEERIMLQMSSQKFGAYVMGVLGAIAIVLTLLGTYVMAESMAVLRMRDMGIRAALGATRSQLASIVFAETVQLVGIGLTAGLLLVWAGAGTIRAFLYRVQPLDPWTLATMAALVFMLAIVVSLSPALRAARVDIASVLKEE